MKGLHTYERHVFKKHRTWKAKVSTEDTHQLRIPRRVGKRYKALSTALGLWDATYFGILCVNVRFDFKEAAGSIADWAWHPYSLYCIALAFQLTYAWNSNIIGMPSS
jgi:hypothetical protein